MPVCPKCGKEIDRLNVYQQEQTKNELSLDAQGDIQSIEIETYDAQTQDIECPECSQTLSIYDWDEAERFLKGKPLTPVSSGPEAPHDEAEEREPGEFILLDTFGGIGIVTNEEGEPLRFQTEDEAHAYAEENLQKPHFQVIQLEH